MFLWLQFRITLFRFTAIVLLLLGMTACGKMPSDVDLYPGMSKESYEQVYPAPDSQKNP
jgi:hypothetical protein